MRTHSMYLNILCIDLCLLSFLLCHYLVLAKSHEEVVESVSL